MLDLVIENQKFPSERALYNLTSSLVRNCVFAGEEDGESALKECRDVKLDSCKFELRYPLWHAKGYEMTDCEMAETVRAPIWYSDNGIIKNSRITGIKCLRECQNTLIDNSNIVSDEFGWLCNGVKFENTEITSQYLLFQSKNIEAKNLKMKGKYSFQYCENVVIEDSFLDTKDAFWHAKNVTVKNSVVKGEYLAWYCENVPFENCVIIGTQPLCYCKDLTLINCTMEETDLSFEYSDVKADIKGNIVSVKNPASGYINADSIGEIILDGSIMECRCEIKEKTKIFS
ncbi:MAG: DUF3737 family protein [Clostridia bacterium]|nr:DUF3737 family protein [Clostridia bacterium]